MAKPRVFVSSTYYDLKHVRAALENFIESLGFEAILFEKGDIPFTHDAALDESCYREVATADILVLVIGGRYGSAASSVKKKRKREFFEKYDSITKREHAEAVQRDIPVYVLVEAGVDAEYQTYRKNRDNKKINYAHVDSVNIFKLLDAIYDQGRNNPVHTFERSSDIENWLREQWAGRFRDFLHQQSDRQQLSALSDQVVALKAVNKTFEKYLEVIIEKLSPDDATQIIEEQHTRLSELQTRQALERNPGLRQFHQELHLPFSDLIAALKTAESFDAFLSKLADHCPGKPIMVFRFTPSHINEARALLDLPRFVDVPYNG